MLKVQKSIPLRIHINGTRGKSSVVNFLSFFLRMHNIKVFGKISGTTPTLIKHNGIYEEIVRLGPARVIEQRNKFIKAFREKSDSIVFECMSIHPELQKIESKILSPNFYVLTEIKEDHFESMGSNLDEQAAAMISAIPNNTTVISILNQFTEKIIDECRRKNSKVVFVDEGNLEQYRKKFGYADGTNIALSATLLEFINIEFDPNDLTVELLKKKIYSNIKFKINGYEVEFINGFSINDTKSTIKLFQENISEKDLIIIFNTRNDRPIRSERFAEILPGIKNKFRVIITGDHSSFVFQKLISLGIAKENIFIWNEKNIENLKDSFGKLINSDTLIIGIANIANAGKKILSFMLTHST